MKTATITLDLTLLTTSSPNIDIQPLYSTTCYGRQERFRFPDIRFSHGAKMVITSSDSKRFILIYNCFFV